MKNIIFTKKTKILQSLDNWNYFINPSTMNPNGFPEMAKFNRDTCIQILRAMLLDERPTIHYLHQDEKIGSQIKHNYRFFVLNNCGHYNVSGLVSAAFGVNVNDRSQAFSVNTLSHEEDIIGFRNNLAKLLSIPELILEDLILSAKETLVFGFSPQAAEFLPLVSMPPADRDSDEKPEPITLPS
jgi:hypothetical protein